MIGALVFFGFIILTGLGALVFAVGILDGALKRLFGEPD